MITDQEINCIWHARIILALSAKSVHMNVVVLDTLGFDWINFCYEISF